MRRHRATNHKPAKAQQPARNRSLSALSKGTKIARLARELSEAREQQAATLEVLSMRSQCAGTRSSSDGCDSTVPSGRLQGARQNGSCEASASSMWQTGGRKTRIVTIKYFASWSIQAGYERHCPLLCAEMKHCLA